MRKSPIRPTWSSYWCTSNALVIRPVIISLVLMCSMIIHVSRYFREILYVNMLTLASMKSIILRPMKFLNYNASDVASEHIMNFAFVIEIAMIVFLIILHDISSSTRKKYILQSRLSCIYSSSKI